MSAPDAAADARGLRGRIGGTGAVTGGTGFRIDKTGPGAYTIGFLTPYPDVPVVLVTPASIGTVATAAPSAVGAEVTVRDHTGAPVDAAFGFLVEPIER